ncbi:hypothetical protein B0H17DRAFT_1070406, partial [Mycena rosella]
MSLAGSEGALVAVAEAVVVLLVPEVFETPEGPVGLNEMGAEDVGGTGRQVPPPPVPLPHPVNQKVQISGLFIRTPNRAILIRNRTWPPGGRNFIRILGQAFQKVLKICQKKFYFSLCIYEVPRASGKSESSSSGSAFTAPAF